MFIIFQGLFLLADWILPPLGSFIVGYFTRSHFFNWLNNIFLLIAGLGIEGIIYLFSNNSGTKLSSSTSSTSTSSSSKASSSSNFVSSGKRKAGQNSQSRHKRTGQPMSLLDYLQDGNQLEAYLPGDVSEGLKDFQKYVIELSNKSHHPENREKLDTIIQLHFNFLALKNVWNDVKSNETRGILEEAIQAQGNDNSEPVKNKSSNDSIVKQTHQLMLKQFSLMKDVYEGKQVNLEYPALQWVNLRPIFKQLSRGQQEKIYLPKKTKNYLVTNLNNGNIPIRYHGPMLEDLHSNNPNKVISGNFDFKGIPYHAMCLEFEEHNIWLNLLPYFGKGKEPYVENMKTGNKMVPHLITPTPQAFEVLNAAIIGKKPDTLSKSDLNKIIGITEEISINPLSINIRAHVVVPQIENLIIDTIPK